MKPSKLYEALHALIGERVPLHIWGPCGVGKSQIVGQVAADLGFSFLDVRAVQLDPVDLRGLPRIAADQTEWVPPKERSLADCVQETRPDCEAIKAAVSRHEEVAGADVRRGCPLRVA